MLQRFQDGSVPHFQQFAVLGDGAVATDIEVVTYSPETTGLMVTK